MKYTGNPECTHPIIYTHAGKKVCHVCGKVLNAENTENVQETPTKSVEPAKTTARTRKTAKNNK